MKRYTYKQFQSDVEYYNKLLTVENNLYHFKVGGAYGYTELIQVNRNSGYKHLIQAGSPRECMQTMQRYHTMWKKYKNQYVIPDGKIVRNINDASLFYNRHACVLNSFYIDKQLFYHVFYDNNFDNIRTRINSIVPVA